MMVGSGAQISPNFKSLMNQYNYHIICVLVPSAG